MPISRFRNGLNDPAVGDLLAIAVPTHGRQFVAERGKLPQSLFDRSQVVRRDHLRFPAIAPRLAGERNERADFVDREAQPAAIANEVEPLDITRRVSAATRHSSDRLIEQPDLLVEADRRHLGGGRARQVADHHAALISCVHAGVPFSACFYSDWRLYERLMSEPASSSCTCHGDEKRAQHDPAYRHALTVVVVLNLGFGLCELVGGFVADSQALKADSLDFLGDGSISMLGLIALTWSVGARARIALTQGLFLGALGLGVIGFAIWRALNAGVPEAELMGGIGVVALAVNVTSALVLARFREGDANVRAIWLFSRNDAIANIAVIIAAGLVAWTGSAWPDLAVAGIIALLFLHSAYEIVRNALAELRPIS